MDNDKLPYIELRPAHIWTCDKCYTDNFEQGIIVEMSPEEKMDYAEQFGVDPQDVKSGEWMTIPEDVTCRNCGAKYNTVHWKDDSHDVSFDE